MNALAILLALGSVALIWLLDRWLSRPTFYELTRFPGNDVTLKRHMDIRERHPELFLPIDTSAPRKVQWPLLTWNRQ